MKCEFEYCIYNMDNACILKNIEVNMLGMCDSCIVVSLEQDFLERMKMEQLEKIEMRWLKEIESK